MSINGETIDGASIGGAAALDEEQYQLWLRDPSSVVAHLVEFDYHDISGGALVTRTLKSADRADLAFTGYPDRVKSIGSFVRQIGDRFTGTVSASIGEIEFWNHQGWLDQWHRLAVDGQRLRVLHGDPSWPYERYRLVYECIAEKASTSDEKSLKLQLRTVDYKANLPIQTNLITTSGPNGNANQPVPLAYGDCFNVEPACLDVVNQVYQVNDGAISSVSQARDGGVPFQTAQTTISAVVANLMSTPAPHGFVANTRVRCDVGSMPVQAQWTGICWNGRVFCAIAAGAFGTLGAVATSPDGIVWTQGTLPSTAGWGGIAWSGSAFCIVDYGFIGPGGTTSRAAISPDGLNWTAVTLPLAGNWHAIKWNGSYFCTVCASTGKSLTSPDGLNWTIGNMPSAAKWMALDWSGSQWCAVAGDGGGTTAAATSTDGITWTPQTLPTSAVWANIKWNGSQFCAISSGSTAAATSPDGVSWTARTLPSSASWSGIDWSGSVYCITASGSTTAAATSPDGITWTARTLPVASNWYAIAWNGSVFCTAGGSNSNYVVVSSDGITWSSIVNTLPSPLAINTDYWVIADGLTTTAFKLSATHGGSVITLTSATTGAALIGYHWTADITTGKLYLDQKPAGKLTCDAVGTSTDASTLVVTALAAVNVDTTSQERFQAICSQRMGIYIKERRNRLDVAADIINGIGAWYGYSRDGMLRIGRVEASPTSYDFSLIADDIRTGTIKIEKILPPEKKHRLSFRKNWTNQSGQLFAGVSADSRVLFSNDYSTTQVQPQTTLAGDTTNSFHALAVVPDVQETMMALAADAITEAVRLDALYYDWCAIFSLEAKRIATQFDIGHVINVNHSRFGLGDGTTEGGGTNMTVVYIEDQPSADKVILKLFAHFTAYTPGQL